MAVLISCIWKTHSGHYQLHLHAGFMPNFSCLSHLSQPSSLAVGSTNDAKRKSSNYLQVSLSAYIASECVLTRLLYQCSEKLHLKQHPSCCGCQGHMGRLCRQSCAKGCTLPWRDPLVYRQRLCRTRTTTGDNPLIIYLKHCHICGNFTPTPQRVGRRNPFRIEEIKSSSSGSNRSLSRLLGTRRTAGYFYPNAAK